jgi:protein involved in polysaccharide export with SLBB domain
MTRFLSKASVLFLIFLAGALPASAQEVAVQSNVWDAQQVGLSRVQLDSLLQRYNETAASTAYSGALRDQARRDAEMIRTRLDEGDFQLGDQVSLRVEGEDSLTGVFIVQAGPALILPALGTISLRGVLRSELESHLRKELARFIREPVVQARSSIRLLISGGVGKSGYYVMPTNTVFSDLLMQAGGPAPNAKIQAIRVERGDDVIWGGEGLQQAIIQGRTLDQLSIRAGDHVVVPEKGSSPMRMILTTVAPVVVLVSALTRIFRVF